MRPFLDTNIISELMRREPHPAVRSWAIHQTGYLVSSIVIEELIFGITRRQLMMKGQWLDEFLAQHCEQVPVTPTIARHSGILRGQLAARGVIRHPSDMLIAATALAYQAPLATRNNADFEDCGLQLINPFHP